MTDDDEPRGLRGYLAGLNDGPGGKSMDPEHAVIDVGSDPGPEPRRGGHLERALEEMDTDPIERARERERERREGST